MGKGVRIKRYIIWSIGILRDVKGIGVVEFDRRDIVRHELVKHIVEAFDRHGESEAPPVRTDRKS